jgi:CubicO group peptidase (beta-lactamase class C family)
MQRRLILTAIAGVTFLCMASPAVAQNYPSPDWERLQHPDQAGWNVKRLDTLREFIIDSTHVTGFMIVNHGKVVMEFGDVEENSYIASCRKSVLSILYGEYVKSGVINLSTTLVDLGIDDIGGLLPVEKEATIQDLISARSGVFHPASYPGDFMKYAPARGSVKHGEYWLYSNWDFNLAGYVFEQATHKDIYDEVERVLAVPLHMQDWKRDLQHKAGDTTVSIYKAYPMWFSTRDMARIGLLMLHNGRWGDTQIIDPQWVREMLKPRTHFTEINKHVPVLPFAAHGLGYGYLWWLWEDVNDERFRGGYSALGNMGQTITVFPAIDVVVVFKTKAAYERATPAEAWYKMLISTVKSIE